MVFSGAPPPSRIFLTAKDTSALFSHFTILLLCLLLSSSVRAEACYGCSAQNAPVKTRLLRSKLGQNRTHFIERNIATAS